MSRNTILQIGPTFRIVKVTAADDQGPLKWVWNRYFESSDPLVKRSTIGVAIYRHRKGISLVWRQPKQVLRTVDELGVSE